MGRQNAESGATIRPLPIRLSYSSFNILHSFHHLPVQALAAPLGRPPAGGKEDVDVPALDRAAAVDHFDGLGVVVAGDLELGAERERGGVGGDEGPAVVADPAAAGGQAAGGTA